MNAEELKAELINAPNDYKVVIVDSTVFPPRLIEACIVDIHYDTMEILIAGRPDRQNHE